ncbi:hypothetical protein [Mameliella alba]|uniref:hypothetical protein n=1 Tax=Mameliella alba TaxID=561184 RepID=UPI000B532DB7|nr:hypothetical protein [Mameliella alba]OWV43208.1 hypothetical protein CDZ95_10475 [Mameliella alba]BBU57414.1 hypothetical protein KU6B_36790 [Mameliella alba]
MSDDRPEDRFLADTREVFESMWPQYLAQVLLELFEKQDAITRDELIAELDARLARDNTGVAKAQIDGALKALRAFRP